MKTTALKLWMQAATPEEQEALASTVGTSRGTLYQYAGGHLQASASRGAAIERVTTEMRKANPRLPIVYRTDTVEACRDCEFARRCLGDDVVVKSHFEAQP
jgi:DNA-binding transcriptional regulator YdaS (Cro superfamily)